jgi:hypothetical protein
MEVNKVGKNLMVEIHIMLRYINGRYIPNLL